MKKMRKLLAVLLASVMVLAMAIPAMASTKKLEEGKIPSATDKGTVTISGLKDTDTVSFYQIVKANYDGKEGFKGYEIVYSGHSTESLFDASGNNVVYPSAEQITELAGKTASLTKKVENVPVSGGTATADLEVGEWLAIVTPKTATADDEDSVVYNPMVVSVYYSGDNGQTITGGDLVISEQSKYNITGTDAFAKKGDVDLKKTIVSNGRGDAAGKKGDDLGEDEVINFKLETTIPAYTKEYAKDSLKFDVYDLLSKGLTLNEDSIVVKVAGAEVEKGATTYTLTTPKSNEKTFEVSFAKDYLYDTEAARKVEITYSATLNKDATVNFDANTNDATVDFSNAPGENYGKLKDKTYQYTFAIDGNINGSKTEKNRKGHELIKVDENGDVVIGQEPTWIDEGTQETTITQGLAGATFQLTQTKNAKDEPLSAEDKAKKTYIATTDENGYFNGFDRLDAGTYTLKETEAPDGYSVNTNEVEVVIRATYDDDTGLLQTFTITIDGKKTTTYSAEYEADEVKTITTVGDPETFFIKNTKMSELPSTGGMGTTLFTVGGIAVMIAAAGLFFASRRRRA